MDWSCDLCESRNFKTETGLRMHQLRVHRLGRNDPMNSDVTESQHTPVILPDTLNISESAQSQQQSPTSKLTVNLSFYLCV